MADVLPNGEPKQNSSPKNKLAKNDTKGNGGSPSSPVFLCSSDKEETLKIVEELQSDDVDSLCLNILKTLRTVYAEGTSIRLSPLKESRITGLVIRRMRDEAKKFKYDIKFVDKVVENMPSRRVRRASPLPSVGVIRDFILNKAHFDKELGFWVLNDARDPPTIPDFKESSHCVDYSVSDFFQNGEDSQDVKQELESLPNRSPPPEVKSLKLNSPIPPTVKKRSIKNTSVKRNKKLSEKPLFKPNTVKKRVSGTISVMFNEPSVDKSNSSTNGEVFTAHKQKIKRSRIKTVGFQGVILPDELDHVHFSQILIITQFVSMFRKFLNLDQVVSAEKLMEMVVDPFSSNCPSLIRLVIALLSVLFQDSHNDVFRDIGLPLVEVQVNEYTLSELVRLVLQIGLRHDMVLRDEVESVVEVVRGLGFMEFYNLNGRDRLMVLDVLVDLVIQSELFRKYINSAGEGEDTGGTEDISLLRLEALAYVAGDKYWIFQRDSVDPGVYSEKGWRSNWRFEGGLWEEVKEEQTWLFCNEMRKIDNLIVCLGERDRIRSLMAEDMNKSSTISDLGIYDDNNYDNFNALLLDLIETETKIRVGCLGSLDDLEGWRQRLYTSSGLAGLGQCLLDLYDSVNARFTCGVLMKNSAKNQKGKNQTVRSRRWRLSVEKAGTGSRLHVLLRMLDSCIKWEMSAESKHCLVCRSRQETKRVLICESCLNCYHPSCLRPPPHFVNFDVVWYCKKCPKNRKSETPKSNDERALPNVLCCVCHSNEDLIICSLCSSAYHMECHHPQLFFTPKPRFVCQSCCHLSNLALGDSASPEKSSPMSTREKKTCLYLLGKIRSHQFCWPFLKPRDLCLSCDIQVNCVNVSEAINFNALDVKLHNNEIRSIDKFIEVVYNLFETIFQHFYWFPQIYNCAVKLRQYFDEVLSQFDF